MFHAFVIACAVSISGEVNNDICVRYNDTYGPFKTEENCRIREQELALDVLEGALLSPTLYVLDFPPGIYVESDCKKIDLGEEV